ncbi:MULTISPECIES: HdeD family acid-resistance protein [unclassified Legionella]|uniref:HdeD family acid-resistance protein n=1 Tax=unclassified Legionella TaxID=2622702 RepID=UPI0010546C02|nr:MULTISPECIES: HdeD family acid-resistance protein [unclassified Legionella]MDI9817781.1 HdeD family acid-resistance protein [Legionella sp. PL877]
MSNARTLETQPQELRRSWGWLLALGILFVILGSIGLGMVVGLTLVSMLFLGVLLIIAGVSQIVDVVKSRHWKAVAWHAFTAMLYIVGGVLIIYDPFMASMLITAMLATVLIIIGISRLFMAFIMRKSSGWVWLFLAGLVAIALGTMILMKWPLSGLWVIGLFVAIEIIVDGWSYIFLALTLRRAKKTQ